MLSLILFVLTLFANCNILRSELVHVQVLSRHADRAPIMEYSPDSEFKKEWPNGPGEVTMLGKKQQYMTGGILKEMYKYFVTSNPNEVEVHSSEADRCIVSAQMNTASFFRPDSNWTVIEHLHWQPIEVYYKPKREDKYLYPFQYCPCAAKANLLNLKLIEDEIKEKYKGFFENISKDSNQEIKNFKDLIYFSDVFSVRKIHNLTIPSWVEKHWEVFDFAMEKYFDYYSNSFPLKRLRGALLEIIIEIMIKVQNGELEGNKVQIYLSHDIVLSTVLSAAGLWNGLRPPYCATVLFELHKRAEDAFFVRFLYLNSTKPELGRQKIHLLKLPGCSEFCPLEYFVNHTSHVLSKDWKHDCQMSHESENEYCGEEWFEDMEPL